ncbi:MAG: hypothetical protein VX777_07130 [Chlamydiota bacterium]|nr:hypothetical protein [Chlamydiota bacterium]
MTRKLHKTLHKTKRRFITLIEIMIVMFLIALITGALAYNFRGSLDEGKAFKTKTGMEKIEMILNLRVAEDPSLMDSIESSWQEVIKTDPLVKDPKALIYDGWGQPYTVTVEENVIKVRSPKYIEYKKTPKSSR